MESLSRPPHRRKHSTPSSSSSFSLKNPYDGVSLARGGKAKFEPREYAEIFSGSSSIPVLDISGLNEPARPGGCRSSELDYSNIFGGARGDDVAESYEQLFNGVPKKTKNRISADAESPYQERGSLNSTGKATRVDGVSVDGTTPLLNMSFNKTNQAISNESNGKTHIAQLHAVSGFTHFVDGTPQLQKKGGERPVVSMKRDVSRTWSFRSGIGATTVNGGLSPENSYTPDNSCKTNGVNVKLHNSELRPTSGHLSGSNDNKDINHSGLPSFSYKDASKETAGEHSPPLSDEELDENSDAAVSIAALRKAIEQAQESIRLAKMIVQKKREGIVDGSRAKRSKNRSEVEGKKENRIEHASSGSLTENSDPTFSMFTRTVGKSAPILGHSGEHVNAPTAKVETVRENFEEAKDHGSAFIDVDKKCAASSSESESLSTDKKIIVEDIRQNIGEFEPHAERLNFSGSVETVALEAGRKVDSNDNLARSKATAVPCLEHIETDQDTLEQTESIMHQQEGHKDFFARPENVVNTSSCVQELEQGPNEETEESCQVTVSPIEGLADIGEQLERVLGVSRSSLEQEKITHGGERLWISNENEPEDSDSTDDKEKCEQKCVVNEELYLDKHVTMPRSNFDTSQNESPRLAETNMVDVADIDKQHENVSEWKEDGQDGKCSDTNENEMAAKEEILWFESELQLEESAEEEISERGPEIYPEVREVATKVDVVLEPKIDDKKLNFELENNSQTVPGEHEENEIALGCMNAAETIQILENNDSEVPSGEFSSDFEELNDTDEAAGRMTGLQDNIEELNDSASEKDSSESFGVHFNDPCTILRDGHGINTRNISSETLEPCNDDLTNEAEKCQAVLRRCEENKSLPQETERFLAVEVDKTGKGFDLELNNMPGTDAEKFTKSQLNNTFEEFGDSKFTSIPPMSADNEKILPNDEEFCSTTEFHSSAVEYSTNTSMHNFPEPHVSTDDQVKKCDSTNEKQDRVQASEDSEESQSSSTIESIDEALAHESPDCSNVAKDISSDKEEVKGQQNERTNTEDQSRISQTNCQPKEMYKSVEAEKDIETGQNTENNMQNLSRASTSEQKDAKGNEQKCEIDDHLQRIEAIKKGREREKDRITVERVIREARERAFADARERAERASVERAAAEARQRVVGEKTMKKAPTEAKPSTADKASMEAKLRAERAAVERATTEARERALEKAMSQKTSVGARVSSSSRNIGLKQSSSDPEKLDANSESTQRRKARLERHQRIMERAAKALAEKNMRDLLVQKEQAERSRLAEPLDAEIKRWATGKEGNLRALLSTLQYILGPESGWQPIPLTEIVTTAAVRKSYRKATLCVHPDKLQQRGASIQQKYICEKIFYLLKAAWNRFNSEEN